MTILLRMCLIIKRLASNGLTTTSIRPVSWGGGFRGVRTKPSFHRKRSACCEKGLLLAIKIRFSGLRCIRSITVYDVHVYVVRKAWICAKRASTLCRDNLGIVLVPTG